jgi:hypothetical protein
MITTIKIHTRTIKGTDSSNNLLKMIIVASIRTLLSYWKRTSRKEVKKEILKLLDVNVIYPISDNKWVTPVTGEYALIIET